LPIAQTTTFSDLTHYTTIKWNRSSSSQSASTQTLTINCPSGSEDEYALTGVKFSDKSKAFANNTYASSIDYYYTPATASYSKKLHKQVVGGVTWLTIIHHQDQLMETMQHLLQYIG